MFQWNEAGTGAEANTRQMIQMLGYRNGFFYPPSDGDGIYLAQVAGGAGDRIMYDGVNAPHNFMSTPDEWIWVCHVFDARPSVAPNRGTYTYIKRSGQPIYRSMFRSESVVLFTPPYGYTSRGWYTPHPDSQLWGYWGDIRPPANGGFDYDTSRYLEIDRVRATNGWLSPPQGTWAA